MRLPEIADFPTAPFLLHKERLLIIKENNIDRISFLKFQKQKYQDIINKSRRIGV